MQKYVVSTEGIERKRDFLEANNFSKSDMSNNL